MAILMIPCSKLTDRWGRKRCFMCGLVKIVQSSFPEELQGEISGLSRSVSNLGSSFGTAIAGTILVSVVASGNAAYAWAMAALAVIALVGLVAGILLLATSEPQTVDGISS